MFRWLCVSVLRVWYPSFDGTTTDFGCFSLSCAKIHFPQLYVQSLLKTNFPYVFLFIPMIRIQLGNGTGHMQPKFPQLSEWGLPILQKKQMPKGTCRSILSVVGLSMVKETFQPFAQTQGLTHLRWDRKPSWNKHLFHSWLITKHLGFWKCYSGWYLGFILKHLKSIYKTAPVGVFTE